MQHTKLDGPIQFFNIWIKGNRLMVKLIMIKWSPFLTCNIWCRIGRETLMKIVTNIDTVIDSGDGPSKIGHHRWHSKRAL